MFNEENVDANGAGSVYNEIVSAIQECQISQVAIFGYSHGGGSTHDLAERLDDNVIGNFTISYTAYIDAVGQDFPFADQERERPPGTDFHANYYQPNGAFELGGGPIDPPGANFEVDVSTTQWGISLEHHNMDDHINIRNGIIDQLITIPRVAR